MLARCSVERARRRALERHYRLLLSECGEPQIDGWPHVHDNVHCAWEMGSVLMLFPEDPRTKTVEPHVAPLLTVRFQRSCQRGG